MSTYNHGHHESVLRSHRWRTVDNSAAYLADRLTGSEHLLDVGCGPGTLTVDLARHVAAVTALETGPEELELCRREAHEQGQDYLEFVVGDVSALAFPDDTFDVTHAHQVLQHLIDPVGALREMARVTRPGGLVAVRDVDYATFTWFPQNPPLQRWLEIYQGLARANRTEPDAGRRLLAWAHEAGLRRVLPTATAWCFANDADRAWWGGMWADRVLQSRFADQAYARSLATSDELAEISEAWRAWAEHPDGWISLTHGELLIEV
ncbi:SAM-dependent methyltransferase [Enemella dayhoffiae]|uniref:SAM-dependent methyltransferase n=1 Tax=Enemella dayhoffiae TaxID=2016507 RepID=A0A255GUQ8_9ACTN|nr:class I SAM-dependent methyltransferase [Enemella dayhoffiae]OYO19408.1 SAM-dependent methyltransferase [Enemella dayhoffiae]